MPRFSPPYQRLAIATVLAWGLPLAWVGAASLAASPEQAARRTATALTAGNAAIAAYVHKYGSPPMLTATLLAFARINRLPLARYDGFAQRLDYVRLGKADYILRSFGEDGRQNHLLSQESANVAQLGDLPSTALTYRYATNQSLQQLDLFPGALLAGSDAPNRVWFARLIVDPATNRRSLLVRHRDKRQLFMLAPHDQVEEFLWLPSGYQIVFSAAGSSRYTDGIYLWNLIDDSVTDLLATALAQTATNNDHGDRNGLFQGASTPLFWLALAGVTLEGPTVFAYVTPRTTATLDPAAFFQRQNLISLRLHQGDGRGRDLTVAFGKKPTAMPPTAPSADAVPTDPLGSARVDWGAGGTAQQQAWFKLPTTGTVNAVLPVWQEFTANAAEQPLFPYCLWYVSTFYADAFALASPTSSSDADVLRSYGVELAQALSRLVRAPVYLRGIGAFISQQLQDGKPIGFKIAHLDYQQGPASSDGDADADADPNAEADTGADAPPQPGGANAHAPDDRPQNPQ